MSEGPSMSAGHPHVRKIRGRSALQAAVDLEFRCWPGADGPLDNGIGLELGGSRVPFAALDSIANGVAVQFRP